MDQYVIISFSEDRTVFVDGTPCGQTNKTIVVQRGTHTFTLADPQNYTPTSVTRLVSGTTQDDPLTLTFTKN